MVLERENLQECIPLVDLQNLHNLQLKMGEEVMEIAKEFSDMLHCNGYAYLINHGIPHQFIESAFEESKKFFEQPAELKLKCGGKMKDGKLHYHGYGKPKPRVQDGEYVNEIRENFEIIQDERFWPETCPGFQPAMETLENVCQSLEYKLLQLLAISIKLENPNHFCDLTSYVSHKLNNFGHLYSAYYPPMDNIENLLGVTRCAQHTDKSIITLVFQDEMGGLEVKTAQGQWIPIKPIPDTIVVNIGDLLEIWTSGYFPATIHQVVVPQSEIKRKVARQSLASFVIPDAHILVEPLTSPGLPIPRPDLFNPITAQEIIIIIIIYSIVLRPLPITTVYRVQFKVLSSRIYRHFNHNAFYNNHS